MYRPAGGDAGSFWRCPGIIGALAGAVAARCAVSAPQLLTDWCARAAGTAAWSVVADCGDKVPVLRVRGAGRKPAAKMLPAGCLADALWGERQPCEGLPSLGRSIKRRVVHLVSYLEFQWPVWCSAVRSRVGSFSNLV